MLLVVAILFIVIIYIDPFFSVGSLIEWTRSMFHCSFSFFIAWNRVCTDINTVIMYTLVDSKFSLDPDSEPPQK